MANLDFVDDFDRQLKFFTDCRSKFKRLEIVQVSKKSPVEIYSGDLKFLLV